MKFRFASLSIAAPLLLISGTALAHPGHEGGYLHDYLAVALFTFIALLAAYLYRGRGQAGPSASGDAR